MGYEEDAKELMRKFKLQHEQSMKNMGMGSNDKVAEILKRNENKTSEPISENTQDISNIINKAQPLSNTNITESTEQGPYSESITKNDQPQIINDIPQSLPDVNTSESPEQGPYSEHLTNNGKTQVINITPQTAPAASAPVTGNVCSQCKTLHPPLRPGEQCPNKTVDLSEQGLDETTINKFIVDIRNMIVSQMDLKKVQDGKKFFQFTIIELMKILEGYNE